MKRYTVVSVMAAVVVARGGWPPLLQTEGLEHVDVLLRSWTETDAKRCRQCSASGQIVLWSVAGAHPGFSRGRGGGR